MSILFFGYIFWMGGMVYQGVELYWSGKTHGSMFFAGGISMLLIDLLCNVLFPRAPLLLCCLMGRAAITGVELITGIICNLWLKKNVWNYSTFRCHFLGQICLRYSCYWGLLTVPALALLRLFRQLMLAG